MKLYPACFLCAALFFSASAAYADETELLSAQRAYQQVLKDYNRQNTDLENTQRQLAAAQQKLAGAQADVRRLEEKAAAEQARRQELSAALEAAGARLDAAWQNRR